MYRIHLIRQRNNCVLTTIMEGKKFSQLVKSALLSFILHRVDFVAVVEVHLQHRALVRRQGQSCDHCVLVRHHYIALF